jgi:hypothetical protein
MLFIASTINYTNLKSRLIHLKDAIVRRCKLCEVKYVHAIQLYKQKSHHKNAFNYSRCILITRNINKSVTDFSGFFDK